jgi:multidrug efflux system outer membrane protein
MSKHASRSSAFALTAGIALLTGCSVGPNYVQPTTPTSAAYKETGPWKKAEPRDDISKGDWYTVFRDPKLNDLEAQAQTANQTLRAAVAKVSEARAVARQSEAQFFPAINFEGSGSRQRTSPNNGQIAAQTHDQGSPYTFNSATVVPFDLSYELDIWGKIRRAFESSGDLAQANLADYENVLLTLKADVATDYFGIRTADSQIDVQRRSIKSFQDAFNLTNSRFQGGISTQLDVEQAQATLAAAQAQLATLQQNRAQLEHALAVLLGQTPESFTLPFHPLAGHPGRPALGFARTPS